MRLARHREFSSALSLFILAALAGSSLAVASGCTTTENSAGDSGTSTRDSGTASNTGADATGDDGAASPSDANMGADADATAEGGDAGSSLAAGLVAYYPFNGDALDHSGNRNDCTVVGMTAMATADRFGNANSAYSFEGNAYLDCGSSASLDITGDLTLSVWFNADASSLSGSNQVLVSRETTGESPWYSLQIQNQDQSAVGLCAPTNGPEISISATGTTGAAGVASEAFSCAQDPISPGSWHHAVGVFQAGMGVVIYLDGRLVISTGTTVQSAKSGVAHLLIAENVWNPQYTFHGSLDEIRVYSRALSDAEISLLYGAAPDAGVATDAGSDGAIADGASE